MSGSLKVSVSTRVAGPLAGGLAGDAVTQWQEGTTRALGDAGVTMLRAFPMDKSGRASGAFAAAVHATRVTPSLTRIQGPQIKGVVWSSWLEGTSTRNEHGKFKGYRLFAKTRLALSKMAPEVAQAQLEAVAAEIGGA